jgi:hypothetical protein
VDGGRVGALAGQGGRAEGEEQAHVAPVRPPDAVASDMRLLRLIPALTLTVSAYRTLGRDVSPVRRIAHLAFAFAIVPAASCADNETRDDFPPTPLSVDSTLTVVGRRVPPALLNRYVAQQLGFTSQGGEMRCAYLPLGVAEDRVFLNTLCLELVRAGDSLTIGSGRGGPVALRLQVDANSVRVVSHEAPVDGGGHAASIRRIFPPLIADRVFARVPDHNAATLLQSYLWGEAATRLGLRP